MEDCYWLLAGGAGLALGGILGRWGGASGGQRTGSQSRRARRRSARFDSDASAATHEQQFIAEHLPIGVLLFATSGEIRFANEPARNLLFSGNDPVRRNFLQLLGDAPAAVCQALTGSTDALFTLESDGEQQTFQVLRREQLFKDEQHILLLINPLTREVARREVDLLKKVIRVINHELNNSLASMSSLVSSGRFIVEHPEKLASLDKVFNGIEGRTRHLQKFLAEYAQLSRLPPARPKEVPWPQLLERIASLYPQIELGVPPSNTGWFDEIQVEQALINLVKNAYESEGRESQVKVVFRIVRNALEIGVLDRGRGFSREALEQGLLPFYSTKEGGSGVGLALCREVADGHGGTLKIKKREGGGSAVYLVLPLKSAKPKPSETIALSLTRT